MKKKLEHLAAKIYLCEIIEIIFGLMVSLMVVSPLVGTFFACLDIYWGWIAVIMTLILSALMEFFFFKLRIFHLEIGMRLLGFLVVMIAGISIYIYYSPVLMIQQDPSLYMMKALNLVNYGHIYKPMPMFSELGALTGIENYSDYAALQNGTMYLNGALHVDFYPGGTFFYALIGFFSKSRIFYGQTAVMLVNMGLFFFCVEKIADKAKDTLANVLYTVAFFVAPVIVWFGRGSYSEPVAMAIVLLIALMLLHEKVNLGLLTIAFLMAATVRIDYLLIAIIGVFVLTWFNKKIGLLYTVLAVAEFFVLSKTYWIYSDRIFDNDMPILGYGYLLLIIAYGISFVLTYKGIKEIFFELYNHKSIKIILFIGFLALTCLMFWDNLIPEEDYATAVSHGQMLLTYVESIFDLLFMVFPSIMLIGGLLGIYRLIDGRTIPFCGSVFLLFIVVVYSYVFFGAGNSPQLYWLFRRYYNVLLPVAGISFVLLLSSSGKKVNRIIAVSVFLLSLNLYLNSDQTVNYEGLDRSTIEISDYITDQGVETVLYSEKLRYEISPLVSFSEAEYIPYSAGTLTPMLEELEKKGADVNDILIISEQSIADENVEWKLSYTQMEETYGSVPQETYNKERSLYFYHYSDVLMNKETLYPNVFNNIEGIYSDGTWSEGEIFLALSDTIDHAEKLIIEILDYDHYYIQNNKIEDMDMKLLLNGKTEVPMEKYENGSFVFDISNYSNIISIEIKMNTFSPKECDMGTDSRELGIPVKSIYLE